MMTDKKMGMKGWSSDCAVRNVIKKQRRKVLWDILEPLLCFVVCFCCHRSLLLSGLRYLDFKVQRRLERCRRDG